MEKEDAAFYTVTFRDVFDALYLYTLMYEWMCDNNWHDRKDEDFPEIGYIERTDQKGAKEMWIRWRLKRRVDGAPEHFVKEHIDIDFHLLSIQEHEIIHKGKKIRTNKGEFEIIVNAYLVFDYSQWKKSPLLKMFKTLFQKRTMRKKIEKWTDDLKLDAHRLREAVNTYLKLQQYYPEKETGEFWVKKTGE